MLDRPRFFDAVRHTPFPGTLTRGQVAGMTAILDEWELRGFPDQRWLAYMLATVFHETGQTMAPVREGFKTSDAAARAFVKRQRYKYAVEVGGQVYYGRGLVQLTWFHNYQTMQRLLGIPLVGKPDLALDRGNAVKIMFEGMLRDASGVGDFTRHSLEDYFTDSVNDPVGARRIINGSDKAALIAGYHKQFLADLVVAEVA